MAVTLGFDVYGTLIDTAGIAARLRTHVGERASEFSSFWRAKQLEYAFRRGLMQNYRDFSVCTRQALDYTCLLFKAPIDEAAKAALMDSYRSLPPYPDARDGLAKLKGSGLRLFAFSMGRASDVQGLLEQADLAQYFHGSVTLEEAQMFKPSPAAYSYFLRRAGTTGAQAWLVSGNPFDVIGAVSAGMSGAWVKRSPDAVLDPWEIEPTLIVETLPALNDALLRIHPRK